MKELTENTTVSSAIYVIPAQNLAGLKATLADLNKKAQKLKCPEITLEILGEESKENEQGIVQVWHTVRVTGERPQLKGWLIVGILKFLRDSELADRPGEYENLVLIHPVPGVTEPGELDAYRDTEDTHCDDCKTNRRRDTIIILRQKDNGEVAQVGKNCLKNFTGHDNPLMVAEMAELLYEANSACEEALEDDDWFFGAAKKTTAIDLKFYLTWVAMLVRESGFVSIGKAERSYNSLAPTYEVALECIDRAKKYPDSTEIRRPSAEHKTLAAEALAWIRSDETAEWIRAIDQKNFERSLRGNAPIMRDDSDYLYNLAQYCKMNTIPLKSCGYVAVVIHKYLNRKADLLKLQRALLESHYQGKVGEKGTWTLTVEKVPQSHNSYGRKDVTTFINKMVDAQGNVFTWSTSKENLFPGTTYNLTGFVKSHEKYEGIETTYITRCKILEIIEPEASEETSAAPDLGTCECGVALAELMKDYDDERSFQASHVTMCRKCDERTMHSGKDFERCLSCGFGNREDADGTCYSWTAEGWQKDPVSA